MCKATFVLFLYPASIVIIVSSVRAPPPPPLTATCLQNSTGSPSSSKNSTLPSEIQKGVCGMDGYFMEFPIVYHWLFASQAYKEVFSKSSEMTVIMHNNFVSFAA